ncbi:MAG: amidohydrolase family protein [Bacteroidota bacterium]
MQYNCHLHTFRDVDIPENFLPLHIVRLLANNKAFAFLGKVLNFINPFSQNDVFDRYVHFVKTGKLGSQQKIFDECKAFYPPNFQFVVLSMDMKFMGAGKVPRDFKEQIEELANLSKNNTEVIPFIHVDPRREGIFELTKNCVENKGFKGVKIYPTIGYFPYDDRLYPVYEFCQQKNIPIITHCSPNNPTYFKGSDKELKELLSKSKTPIDFKCKTRKELCSNFTNPENWKYVMQDFPNLRICAAHFGSDYYWDKYIKNPEKEGNWLVIIKQMIANYENFYTDISFTLNDKTYFPLLKTILNDDTVNKKILFGTDFYMLETKADENRFLNDLKNYIGENSFFFISETNPKKFLGIIN